MFYKRMEDLEKINMLTEEETSLKNQKLVGVPSFQT